MRTAFDEGDDAGAGLSGAGRDPGRRGRIIDACLDVIAERGVAGTSHRRIAAVAGVPLGSMTYHFSGIDELLREAFARFADSVVARFEQRMRAAATYEEAAAAVVSIITEDLLDSQRNLVLTQELYTIAARDPSARVLTNRWMARSRAALEIHFDPDTARMLDALIEGLSLHRALDIEAQDPALVALAVRRILGT
ncbi:TetR/AcrR family transcriptional regulator [Schaalia naturae]|uniref:TetR/AcrR family transcriptional regulator n=1 Tax=Schaalia naturae TaxID=635203 RepID=A0ABW2SQZ4_9ACTO